MKQCVWAVIPAYNEEKHISQIAKKTHSFVDAVVVVDDGSHDKTASLARKSRAIVLQHIINMGKGAALRTGCDFAAAEGAEIIVCLDADGQHKPSDIPRFVKELLHNDIVLGYRGLDRSMPLLFRWGNRLLNLETKIFYGVSLKDTQSGFRAFKKKIYRKIRWMANDYSMESEMIAHIGKHKLKYREIPIDTVYKDAYKGTTAIDGLRIVINMLWWKITRR
jgi:glycosyltransferase involved in cell wall biosynthesis